MKEELHQTREDLQQSKETLVEKEDSFRKKLLESDAEIESSKKTIAELQVISRTPFITVLSRQRYDAYFFCVLLVNC